MVDSSILEKLRIASQQYNRKRTALSSKMEFSQLDSQLIPSTQPCTAPSTQQTRQRTNSHSQWDFTLSQTTAKAPIQTGVSIRSMPSLSFDAYCQTSLANPQRDQTTSPKRPRLSRESTSVSHIALQPDVTSDRVDEIIDAIASLRASFDHRFKDDPVRKPPQPSTSRSLALKPTTEDDDEAVYLSFLFDHDTSLDHLYDAPSYPKEVSVYIVPVTKHMKTKSTNRKREPKKAKPAKSEEEVETISEQPQPPVLASSSCLKRARVTVSA